MRHKNIVVDEIYSHARFNSAGKNIEQYFGIRYVAGRDVDHQWSKQYKHAPRRKLYKKHADCFKKLAVPHEFLPYMNTKLINYFELLNTHIRS